MAIALDPAASEFYRDGTYTVAGEKLSSDDMVARYAEIVTRFPVWSLEDGLAEGDWDGWERLNAALGERIQTVGDDILGQPQPYGANSARRSRRGGGEPR